MVRMVRTCDYQLVRKGTGWLASGPREAISYCYSTFCEAPDRDHFPEPKRWSKMLLISTYYIMNLWDRNKFSTIFVAGSFMDVKSIAVYEKDQIFFTIVSFVHIWSLVHTFVVSII